MIDFKEIETQHPLCFKALTDWIFQKENREFVLKHQRYLFDFFDYHKININILTGDLGISKYSFDGNKTFSPSYPNRETAELISFNEGFKILENKLSYPEKEIPYFIKNEETIYSHNAIKDTESFHRQITNVSIGMIDMVQKLTDDAKIDINKIKEVIDLNTQVTVLNENTTISVAENIRESNAYFLELIKRDSISENDISELIELCIRNDNKTNLDLTTDVLPVFLFYTKFVQFLCTSHSICQTQRELYFSIAKYNKLNNNL